MNREEYEEKQDRLKELIEGKEVADEGSEVLELELELVENNSFENPMSRGVVDRVIEDLQHASLRIHGGYPLREDFPLKVNNGKCWVIAYGASNENEGEGALMGMLFVKEESK